MNREKAIQKIVRKLARVIGLHLVSSLRDGPVSKFQMEQQELIEMIRKAVETEWKP